MKKTQDVSPIHFYTQLFFKVNFLMYLINYFLLKDNYFTILYWFLPYINMN